MASSSGELLKELESESDSDNSDNTSIYSISSEDKNCITGHTYNKHRTRYIYRVHYNSNSNIQFSCNHCSSVIGINTIVICYVSCDKSLNYHLNCFIELPQSYTLDISKIEGINNLSSNDQGILYNALLNHTVISDCGYEFFS